MPSALSWKFLFIVEIMLADFTNLGSSSSNSSRKTLEFWRNTDVLCSTASICREEFPSERNAVVENIGKSKTTCCKDCSCSKNCGLQSNCCFEADENVTLIDRSKQECLFPTTKQPQGTAKYNHISYYIFTKYHGNTSLDTGNDRTCWDKDASSLKSLSPVFSKTTGRIYKNKGCAQTFGVDDGILWDAFINCKGVYDLENITVYDRTLEEVIHDLERYGEAPACEFFFIYPEEMNDLKSEQCFQDLIETCKADDFEVPDGMSLAPSEVKEACESGLFAPYVLSEQGNPLKREANYGNYRNVYCAICNGYNLDSHAEQLCVAPSQFYGKLTGQNSLLVILNSSFANREYTPAKLDNYPKACKTVKGKMKEEICRNVFCPTAHYRKQDGFCNLAITQWIATRFLATFKLTFNPRLRIKDVLGMQITDVVHTLTKNWEIISIGTRYVCDDGWVEQNDITSLFITVVSNIAPMSKASKILSDIDSVTSEKWYISVNESLIQARVHFTSMFFGCHTQDSYCIDQLQKRNISQFCMKSLAYSRVPTLLGNVQSINKLFYCEQITLHPQEYEIISDALILIDKTSGKVFFHPEFAIVIGSDSVESVRICVEDSVFKRIDRSLARPSTIIQSYYSWVVIFSFLNIKDIY